MPAVQARSIHSKPRFSISWMLSREVIHRPLARSEGNFSFEQNAARGSPAATRCEGHNGKQGPRGGQHPEKNFFLVVSIPARNRPKTLSLRGFRGWMTGIEPATSGTTIRRSNQLSYIHRGTPGVQRCPERVSAVSGRA